MIHSRISTSTSAGATIGTWDQLTTRNTNNVLPSGTTQIVGLTYVGSRIATTAAKSKQTRLRVSCQVAGMNNEDFLVGHIDGSGIATNNQPAGIQIAEFIPIQREGAYSLSSVNFYLSDAGAAATDANSVCASPVSFSPATNQGGQGTPPAEWYSGRLNWPGWGLAAMGATSSNGTVTSTSANAGTDMTSSTVRGEYEAICAVRLSMISPAVGTAGEEAVGWGAFDNSVNTISGISPQEWPFNACLPTLGTPVGSQVGGHVYPLPVWMAIPGSGDVTVDVFNNLNVGVTAGYAIAYGVFLRK